ncbi:glycosyltransferase family 25 protein [Thauera aminoaromatica]|jgi:glycosyl transferase family 25|nr:glycosyltransferase family 25 protein [Thauera aminoaromatica]
MDGSPIFVVNLAGATVRWERIAQNLCQVGLSRYERFEAVDGRRLPDAVLRERVDHDFFCTWYGRPPSPGEVGCTLSHLGAYARFLETRAPFVVVLEDDALVLPETVALLEDVRLQAWLAADAPRVLLLSAADRYLKRGAIPLGAGHRLTRVRNAWLAHAYLINRAGAGLLLARQKPIRFLVDDWLDLDMVWGLQVSCVQPPCASLHETAAASSLDPDRHGLRANARAPALAKRLRRLLRRLADALYYKPFCGLDKGAGPR